MRRLCALGLAAVLCSRTAAEAPTPLRPGESLARELSAGGVHVYTCELPEGRWRVLVEQRGIDVTLQARDTNGAFDLTVDGPFARRGPEWLVLPAGARAWRLEVRAPERGVGPGRYELRLDALDVGTASGRARLAAEEALTRAGRSTREATPEARRTALAEIEKALDTLRRIGARREEALALDARAALYVLLGEWRAADAGYAAALPLWRELHDAEREAVALNEQGVALWAIGQALPARERLEQALKLREIAGDVHGQAETLANLGLTWHAAGELDTAAALYTRALAMARARGELRQEATLLNNLGGVHFQRGEPDPASAHFERALALRVELGDRKGQAEVLNNLALVARGIGEPQAALQRYAAALEIARASADPRAEGRTLSNMAFAYQVLGEPERARSFYEQALPLRRAAGDREGEAATLNALAGAQLELGQPEQASVLGEQAVALTREVGNRLGQAAALVNLARAQAASDRRDAAAATLERALALAREVGSRTQEGEVQQARGELLVSLGRLETARDALTSALELRRGARAKESEAASLYWLARVERDLGRPAEALRHVRAALSLLEELRLRVVSPELRATFFGARRPTYDLQIELLMDLHRAEPAAGHAREALLASEAARARTLVDLLRATDSDPLAREAPEQAARRAALLRRLSAKAARRLELAARNPSDARVLALDAEINAVRAELDDAEADARRRDPHYAALTAPPALTLGDVQALLDDDTVLLEYALGDTRSFLWRVTRVGLEAFDLGPRAQLEEAARAAYEALAARDVTGGDDRGALARLSQLLLGPLVGRMGHERLVIVPDGALHYVPFAALPEPGATGARATALLAAHEIVSLPSLGALAALREGSSRRVAPQQVLALMADPVFDADDPRLASGRRRARAAESRAAHAPGAADAASLGRLEASRFEAEAIARLLPPAQVRLALGFDATRAALLEGAFGSARLLHLATHGVFDARSPELSGLVLSRFAADGQARDGFVRLQDVYGLRLPSDLVVLSGCQTALGREVRGEGLVGLTRGFMYAGVPRVAASLWRVPDRATSELMTRFYAALLRDGLTPAAALRRAQLELRAERRFADPYFWAAFVLQGDWR